MESKKFCENCGQKLNDKGVCTICEKSNLKKKSNVFKVIFDIIRYIIGGLFILGSSSDLPKIYGIIGILFGLSLFPFIYRNLIPNIIKSNKKNLYLVLAIIMPFVLLILWGGSLPNESSEPNSDFSDSKNTTNKKETEEEKALNQIKLNLSDGESLDSYDMNSNNKYDVKIKYSKTKLSSYTCASDTQYYAKKIMGNKKIGSIQFECINSNGTFNYVKIENIDIMTDENINANTKYFDANYKEINTNLEQLKANQTSEYKKSCKSYKYKDVMRKPDDYQDKNAYWFGEIVQVVSKTSYYSVFRINVTCEKYSYSKGYYCTDTIYVTYYGDQSFIEDDMVKMWGTMDGTETYTTVLGANVTIPKFTATYMELQ